MCSSATIDVLTLNPLTTNPVRAVTVAAAKGIAALGAVLLFVATRNVTVARVALECVSVVPIEKHVAATFPFFVSSSQAYSGRSVGRGDTEGSCETVGVALGTSEGACVGERVTVQSNGNGLPPNGHSPNPVFVKGPKKALPRNRRGGRFPFGQ